MSNWISVNDRLPEKGERVIIYGENIGVSSLICHINIYNEWVNSISGVIPFNKHITHWQPLPEPPTDTN